MACSGGTLNASVTRARDRCRGRLRAAPSIAGPPVHTRHMQALVNLTPVYGTRSTRRSSPTAACSSTTRRPSPATPAQTLTSTRTGTSSVPTTRTSPAACSPREGSASRGPAPSPGTLGEGACRDTSGSNGWIGGRSSGALGSIAPAEQLQRQRHPPGRRATSAGAAARASGKCFANTSSVAPPSVFPLPILRGNDATMEIWRAQGYTVVDDNVCGSRQLRDDQEPDRQHLRAKRAQDAAADDVPSALQERQQHHPDERPGDLLLRRDLVAEPGELRVEQQHPAHLCTGWSPTTRPRRIPCSDSPGVTTDPAVQLRDDREHAGLQPL